MAALCLRNISAFAHPSLVIYVLVRAMSRNHSVRSSYVRCVRKGGLHCEVYMGGVALVEFVGSVSLSLAGLAMTEVERGDQSITAFVFRHVHACYRSASLPLW